MTQHPFTGVHFFANFRECTPALHEIEKLRTVFETAVKASGATIVNHAEYVFKSDCDPHMDGYTCAYILSESHATIHCYPECNSCFVDLFTCGERCQYQPFAEVLKQYLRCPEDKVTYQVVRRDSQITPL